MYQLKYKPGVQKAIRHLPERIRTQVSEIILDLREMPSPPDSLPMRDKYVGFRRIRVDGYRIIYAIKGNIVTMWAVKRRDRKTYNTLL